MNTKIGVKGMFRLQLGEDRNGRKKVIGDSGWLENTITQTGFEDAIVNTVGGIAGSSQVGYMAIATNTDAINSTQTSVGGETNGRKATDNSFSSYGTLECTASWSSTDNGGAADIGSLGLFYTNTGGSLYAGQTFNSSNWATNQNVSATYQLRFQSA